MFQRLRKLFRQGKITEAGLQFWVDKGAITQEEMDLIIRENEDET